MDDEPDPATAPLELALFWRGIYTEILAMEEAVLERIRQLIGIAVAPGAARGRADQRPGGGRPGRPFPNQARILGGAGAGPPAAIPPLTERRCCGYCDPDGRVRITGSLSFGGPEGRSPRRPRWPTCRRRSGW